MKKQLVVVLAAMWVTVVGFSQQTQLIIKGSGKDLHIAHTVSPKEGIFSIGRIYNVHPKAIASYNKLDMSTGLSVGQVLKIPLTDTNFSQRDNKGRPIYYNVAAKDNLEKVSSANKVSLQNLREWNNLTKDEIKAGQKLIVGFLVSNDPASIAANTNERKETVRPDTSARKPIVKAIATTDSVTARNEKKKEDTKKKDVAKKPEVPVDSATKQAVVKGAQKNDKTNAKDKPASDEVKKTESAVTKTDAVADADQQVAKKDTDRPQNNSKGEKKKEEPKQTDNVSVKPTVPMPNAGQGYFKSSFEQQVKINPPVKNETVTSGIFRMTSAPKEEKYYLLIDGVPSGTIVRISNPENNKAVYAKVLGAMSGIRQNQGLNIRISNSAASTLSISDTDKFIVKINY